MSTRTAAPRSLKRKIADEYLELIQVFPLRPIRNHREYEQAASVLDRLAIQPESSLSSGARDYFETLTLLIEDYDERHFQIKTSKMKPIEVLKYLLNQSGMTGADLGRLLGSRPLASLLLNGHRELSRTHIRILSEHFKVDPGLFL